MKKILMLLAAVMMVLTACKDKNAQENNDVDAQKLIGYWVPLDSDGQPHGDLDLFGEEMWYDIFEVQKGTYTHLLCAGEFDGNTFYRTSGKAIMEYDYTVNNGKLSNGVLTWGVSFSDDNHLVLSFAGDKYIYLRITIVD